MKPSTMLRWSALITVLINITFNKIYDKLFHLPSVGEVSREYNDLFTPAGYVFSIWGLIYLSFIIYCILQLMPSRHNKAVYNELSVPLIIANMLASLWIITFTDGILAASMVIIISMLLCAISLFRTALSEVRTYGHSAWLLVPFTLFFGWISVATLANASVLFTASGLSDPSIAITFIIIAALAGIGISFKYKNYIYPAVVAWATMGIWVARRDDHPAVAAAAMIAFLVNVLFIPVGFLRYNMKRVAVSKVL